MTWTEARIWIVGALLAMSSMADAKSILTAMLLIAFVICLAVALAEYQ
jgi:hypothetical protein